MPGSSQRSLSDNSTNDVNEYLPEESSESNLFSSTGQAGSSGENDYHISTEDESPKMESPDKPLLRKLEVEVRQRSDKPGKKPTAKDKKAHLRLFKELLVQSFPEASFSLRLKGKQVALKTKDVDVVNWLLSQQINSTHPLDKKKQFTLSMLQVMACNRALLQDSKEAVNELDQVVQSLEGYLPRLHQRMRFERKKNGSLVLNYTHAPSRERKIMKALLDVLPMEKASFQNAVQTINDYKDKKEEIEQLVGAVWSLYPKAKGHIRVAFNQNGAPIMRYDGRVATILREDNILSAILNTTKLGKSLRTEYCHTLKTYRDYRDLALKASPYLKDYISIGSEKGRPTLKIDVDNLTLTKDINDRLKQHVLLASTGEVNDMKASSKAIAAMFDITRADKKLWRGELKRGAVGEDDNKGKAELNALRTNIERRNRHLASITDAMEAFQPHWKGKIALSFVEQNGLKKIRIECKKLPLKDRQKLSDILNGVDGRGISDDGDVVQLKYGTIPFKCWKAARDTFREYRDLKIELEQLADVVERLDPTLKGKTYLHYIVGKPESVHIEGTTGLPEIRTILYSSERNIAEKTQDLNERFYHRLVVGNRSLQSQDNHR